MKTCENQIHVSWCSKADAYQAISGNFQVADTLLALLLLVTFHGRMQDFLEGGFICIKVWGFALQILSIFIK